MATTATRSQFDVTPWWEKVGVPLRGELFDRANLQPDNPRELRVQLARQEAMHRPEGKKCRVSTHRARLLTESYQQTEGQSYVMRRAKAYYHILANIPIPFSRYNLLAGRTSAIMSGTEWFPEHFDCWLNEAVVDGKRMTELEALPVRQVGPLAISDEDRRYILEELLPYWRSRTVEAFQIDFLERHCPEALRHIKDAQVIEALIGAPFSHTIQDHRSVLEKGLRGLIDDIRGYMADLDLAYPTEGVTTFERREMYEGMILVAEGLIRYAERCAEEAERLAAAESDPEWAAELRKMAEVCRHVPANPARTYREAVQATHFVHMATGLTEGGMSHSGGRVDQYLYPYLKADLEAGRVTREEAQELLEDLFLKFFDYQIPLGMTMSLGMYGVRANDKITCGGTDELGRDASNQLTYMCLEAMAHVHLNDPNLSFRYHKNTPDDLLRCALEAVRVGGGLPQLINDGAIVPALMGKLGTTLEDARHYADIGCQENGTDPSTAPSRADTNGHNNTGWFNLVKPVELAIWNGFNPITGKQAGPQSGDVRQMKTMEEFVAAVRVQVEEAARLNAIVNNVIEYSFAKIHPSIYHNLMHPGPRRTGIDYVAGGCKYNYTGELTVGLGTAGDCLAAVDTIIYRDKVATWDELLAALKDNWVGHEELRAKSIAAPKYGADDDYADAWTKVMADMLFEAYEKHPTTKGGVFLCATISMSYYQYLGGQTGPTPDGRLSQEMLSDTVAPSRYAPALGPTATHRSVTKAVDTFRTVNGMSFNQKFNYSAVANERELSKWADLVRGYFEAGGQSVQYTVVDRRVLQQAQAQPEKYTDLVVRVGGYSALFVELSKELQDSIIARVEQEI